MRSFLNLFLGSPKHKTSWNFFSFFTKEKGILKAMIQFLEEVYKVF